MSWKKLQKTAFILFILIVIFGSFAYLSLKSQVSLDDFQQKILGFGIWAPLIFVFFYTFTTIFLPSTPFMALAGILFGFKHGLLYALIGGLFSSIITFGIARKFGKEHTDKALGNKYMKYLDKYNKRLESGGFGDLIVLRIIPVMPFNALNIIMGLSSIKTDTYIAGTVIGLIPSNVLAVYFGDIISKIF